MGCPATNVMLKDPRFRQMKEDYADRHYSDDCLAQALVLCRKYRGYNSDWYPDTPGRKAWFTRFINFYMVYQQMAQTQSDLSSDDVYNLYSTLYGIYTPEQLESRINMLANDFKTIVDLYEKKDTTNRSRQDLIAAQADGRRNGFKVIMDRVFSFYAKNYTDVDVMMANWKAKPKNANATPEQVEKALKDAKYKAQEYKTILANKERLAAMAAVKIGEDEGFIVTIKDFKVMLDEEDVLTEGEEGRESDGTDKNEGSKGERYGDFRTTKIMATLGPRARRLISRMYKTNVKGEPICDDLGNKQYIGGRQVASVLKRVLVNSSPETMMSDLESAAQYYPWMKGLVEELNKDKDKRATIFNNFKSAETTFVYMNYDNGSYTAKVANSRASGSALMREAGNNLRSGYVFGRYALTTGYGGLKSLEGGNGELGLKAIHERFNEIKSLIQSDEGLKHVKMVEGDEPLKASRREEIITFAKSELRDASHLNEAPKEAIRIWMDRHKSVIATLAELLRGMGFDVSEQDVRDIAMQEMSFKSYAFIAGWKNARKSDIGRNKLYQLVDWMEGIYNTAEQIYNKKDSQKTGQYLFNLADKSFARVNRCLALAQYKELEDRVVNEGKSLSTHNHVNLLHQTFDKLCNKDGRTEEIYLRDLNSDFLQYEGMAIGQGKRQQVFGWLRKFRDNENGMRDNFRIFDVASFNHVEYEKLSRAQKLTSSIVMYFDAGNMMKTDNYCAVEIPIQSDYSTAYNFVFAPKIKTGKLFSKYGSELEYAKDAEIVEELTNEVLAELERISAIEARINDDSRTKLDVYERQGLKFQIFPEFNTNGFREGYAAFADKARAAERIQIMTGGSRLSKSLAEEAKDYVRTQVVQQLKKIVERDIKTIEDAGVLTNPAMKRVDFGNGNYNSMYSKEGKAGELSEAAREKLQEFCLNVFYNRLQATKLLAGGLEQFDGLLDYEKRNMLSHATHTSLYTEATWKGEKVGKESQNVVYIEDDDAKSYFFDDISAALEQLLADKLITQSQYETMRKAYAKIKTTDGQGLRTLESYREVMIMADQWDDRHEAAYDRIIMGEPTKGDIDVFMQNIKPVLTGHEHVKAANGENQKPVRLTVLHKYSESVLLPLALAKYCKITKAVPLKALNLAQEKLKEEGKQVDMFLFHSGVKVGAHSVLQPFAKWRDIKAEFEGDTDEAARKRHGWNGEDLEERILKDANSIANSIVGEVLKKESTIHTIPFKYYGIAASTPAHAANDKIAWATQAEKVAWANIQKGKDTLTLRGEEMDAWEARELYNRIKTAQIIDSYQELRKMFVNTDELEKAFQEELVSKGYSSRELAYALAHLKDGSFALPLFSPNVEHQVQELLSSIIKKRLTKPRTKGANILQESALGYDIEFSAFEENDSIPEDEKLGLVFEGEGKDRHFKYAEFSAPLTDDRLLPYADEYGGISAKRLEKLVRDGIIDEEILYFIAYRTPSDAEHSVIPGKIKYFTPNVVGATIKGPKEIMVTTGHDNDGDKLRCHFADFKIVWDEDKIHEEYEKYLAGSSDSDMMRFIMGQQDYLWEKGGEKITEQEFTKRIKRMEREKDGKAFRKAKYIAYDYNKQPTENSQTARNNAKVELMFAQLSSKAGSSRFLIPGGCDESKIYAKSLSIVRSSADDENKKKIADKIIDQEAKKLMDKDKNLTKAQAIAKVDTGSIHNYVRKSEALYEQLIKRSDRELSDIMKEISGAESPFTLTHSADAFDYIMGGASMISVYATYNAAMQMLQRLDMSYEPQYTRNRDKRYEISFFGHKWGKLFDVRTHDIGQDRGMLASLGLARLLNAAVDNNKDPILGYLNQSREMAEMTFLMFAAGMTEEEIHLVMNQPAIIELVNRMRGREAEGLHKEAVKLAQELSRDKKDLGNLGEFIGVANVAEMKRSDFTKTLSKSINDVMVSEDWDMIEDQISLLYTFAHLSTAATNLGDFVRLTRPDSESGAIGTSVADITTKVIELNKFRAKMNKARTEKGEPDDSILRISGMRDVLKIREEFASENSKSGNLDAGYIAEIIGSDLPEVVALNSMMIDSSLDMFRPYFPQAKLSWINVCAEIASDYKYHKIQEGTVKKIMEEMILFKLLQNDAFVQGDPQQEQKRIIVDVPSDLYDLKIRIDKAKNDPNSTDKVAKELIGNAFLEHLSTTSPENSDIAPRLMFTINGAPAEGTADLIRASWGALLSSSDAKVRKLAIDLFKYNMYRSGFSYGMYEFAHFAPFSVIMSVPGYVKALREVLSSEWDDDYDTENFINQYYMNHWGDKKFLNFYKVSDISKHIVKLPEGVTGQIRLGPADANDESYVSTLAKIESSRYIILLTGEDGKEQTLYRVDKTDQPGVAVILVKAEKLGVRSYHNQVTLQYNPSDDYHLIKHVVPGNDSAWGILEKYEEEPYAQSDINAPGLEGEDAAYMASTDDLLSFMAASYGLTLRKSQIEKLDNEAAKNVEGNPETSQAPAEEEGGPVEFGFIPGLGDLSGIDFSAAMASPEEGGQMYSIRKPSSEMLQIKDEAISNGTFMLAPNGQPTKLTEQQWLQVRTKAFKDWFGDWENDPANASKVIDENGEPMVVYHYTDTGGIQEFDLNRTGQNWKESKLYGRNAIYFLSEPDSHFEEGKFGEYGKYEMQVFLNIRNPEKSDIRSYARETPKNKNTDGMIPEKADNGLFFYGEFVVFNSNQIKSVVGNNGEFSTSNSNIYLNVARRTEDGKVVTEKVPATPQNVREARRQRTFVELNKRLREILRDKGISVGVLSDVEARMSLAGVTDFDTANVTAEGLLEMIRIAEGYVGEEALPEEFAHMALEMLGHDNPLVTRLLNAIGNSEAAMEEAYEGQYAEYKSRYGDENKDKLVLEAAGKLVAKHLLRQQEIKSPVKRLVYRVVEAIKNLLRKFRRDEVQNAIFDANQVASKIAREILSGKLVDQMDLENVKAKGQYQSVRGDLSDKKDILSKLLKNEVKRLNVLKRRLAYHNQKPGAQAVVKATQMQIDKLEAAIANHKTEDAIITYLNDSLLFIAEMDESLKKAIESGKGNSIAKKLNTVRDTLYSFAAAIDDINEAIADGEVADSVDMSSAIKDVSKVLRDLFIEYEKYAKLSFEEMLSSVYGKEGVTVTVGRQKGRKITIKEMARHADKDISLGSRWFHAIADTSDYVLKAIDDIVRNAKMRARRKALNVRPRIEQAINDLVRETGSRDQSFMFEMRRYNGEDWCKGKADDGKLHKTGRYISEEDAKNLSAAQQKFYKTMMEIKKEADEFVPESMLSENKIIMVRKYTMDRFMDAEGAKGKSLEMWEGLKGRVMDMSDDIDFENYEVAVDFEGNRVDSLPLKFLFAGAKESYDDMTSDVATSLMAYAGMAFEYGEMNNVIGILENAKYMASERQVGQMTGTRVQRESIGSEEDDKYWYREAFTVKQAKTRIQEALEDFFQMHVYGHIQKNEGTFGRTRLSKRKVVDAVNAVTSYSQMAINLPQRIANVLTGSTQIALESIGNGAFSAGDIAWAAKEYMKQSADRLAETGETDFDNKLSLWDEYFDVHQDNGRKNGKYEKNRVARAFNSGLLYAGLTMGEDLLASVTSLAIAKNIKVKINGEEATLWDAYTVKYRDPINKSGAYLVMKDNVTKMDGSAWTQEDEIAFSKKVAGTNFELQGIYNTDDKSAVQQYALGALIIMYRKWIAPALKRRYAGAQYNALKGEFEEGYHVTLWRLLHDSVMDAIDAVTEGESGASVWNLLEDFKALRSAILLNWNKMNEYEQSNIKRALGELATVTGLWAACALYGKLPPKEYEDDERGRIMKWWDQTLFSQMLRLRTEIGSQAPTPMLVDEAMHILKSPFAAIGPLQNTINTFQLLLPSNYVQEIKSGRYRGHKKAYKYFRELPIISMFKKVDNFVDPSPLISYYKNDASY